MRLPSSVSLLVLAITKNQVSSVAVLAKQHHRELDSFPNRVREQALKRTTWHHTRSRRCRGSGSVWGCCFPFLGATTA